MQGVLTLAITNPLWVAKTRLCLQYDASRTPVRTVYYKGTLDCITQVYKADGIRGLYKVCIFFKYLCYNSLFEGYCTINGLVTCLPDTGFCSWPVWRISRSYSVHVLWGIEEALQRVSPSSLFNEFCKCIFLLVVIWISFIITQVYHLCISFIFFCLLFHIHFITQFHAEHIRVFVVCCHIQDDISDSDVSIPGAPLTTSGPTQSLLRCYGCCIADLAVSSKKLYIVKTLAKQNVAKSTQLLVFCCTNGVVWWRQMFALQVGRILRILSRLRAIHVARNAKHLHCLSHLWEDLQLVGLEQIKQFLLVDMHCCIAYIVCHCVKSYADMLYLFGATSGWACVLTCNVLRLLFNYLFIVPLLSLEDFWLHCYYMYMYIYSGRT